jgi:surface protein
MKRGVLVVSENEFDLYVNNEVVNGSGSNVISGDRIEIKLCSGGMYDSSVSVELSFGNKTTIVTLRTSRYKFPNRIALKNAVDACIAAEASGEGCYAKNNTICNTNHCGEIGTWDVSMVTDMNGMFNGAESFNQDISGWNTTAVTNMEHMFSGARGFNSNIGTWDTAAVTSMKYMFLSAIAFNADITDWSTPIAVVTVGMFFDAKAWHERYERRDGGLPSNGPARVYVPRDRD